VNSYKVVNEMESLPPIAISDPTPRGHHAPDDYLEYTFDFLKTDGLENGFPLERRPTLGEALSWFVDRGVIHAEGGQRLGLQSEQDPGPAPRDLSRIHAVRGALREVSDAIFDHRPPQAGALDTVNRALHA